MSDGAYGYLGLTVSIDETLDDFLPGRSLLVKTVEVDEVGLRVRYEIRPPIVERPTPRDASWLLSATDDLGNEYESAGGAFGVAPTGDFTEGVHTLTPPPQPGTAFVNIGFIGPASGEDEDPQREIRVRLR